MKDKSRLKKIAAKSAGFSFSRGKIREDNVVNVIKHLKTLPRAQAIYVISKFIKGLKNKNREVNVIIESAIALSDKQISSIIDKLKTEYVITSVENSINPEILGGIRVKIGDAIFDYSLNNKVLQIGKVIRA